MICSNCNTQNVEGSMFCANCGAPLNSNNQVNPTNNQMPTNNQNMADVSSNIDSNINSNVSSETNLNTVNMVDTNNNANNGVVNGFTNTVNSTNNVNQVSEPMLAQSVSNVQNDAPNMAQNDVPNMDQNYQNVNNNSLNNQNVVQEQNGKKKNILPFVIGGIAILLVLILVIVFVVIANPSAMSVFKSNTNKLSKTLSNNLSGKYNSVTTNLEVTPKISNTGSSDIEKVINKVNFKLSAATDYKNKKFDYKIAANYNNNSLINAEAVYDKDMYLSLGDLYSKSIKVSDDSFSDVFKKTGDENTKIVIEKITNAFNKSLKKEYFSKSKEKIDVNGKSINAKVYTMKMTDDNVKEILKSMTETLKKDDKFIEAASKVFDESKSSIKNSLNLEDYSSSLIPSGKNVSISIYTKGLFHKFVKLKLSYDDSSYEFTSLDNDNYNFVMSEDGVSLSFDIKYSYEYNKAVNIDKASDFVSSDDLSTSDLTTIYNKLKENKAYKELTNDLGYDLEKLIGAYTGSGSSDYDSDSDYDWDSDSDSDYDYSEYGYESY